VSMYSLGAFRNYKSGVFVEPNPPAHGTKGFIDHAMTLVGYGTDAATNVDYWLVQNSYGPKWGEEGYIRIRRGKNEANCEAIGFALITPTRVAPTAACTTVCANGAENNMDCTCHCNGAWTGSDCSGCSLTCNGKGTLDSDACTCACTAGISGVNCDEGFEITSAIKSANNFYTLTMTTFGSKFHQGDQFYMTVPGPAGYLNGKFNLATNTRPFPICGEKDLVNKQFVPCPANTVVTSPPLRIRAGSYVIYYNQNLGFNEKGVDKTYRTDSNNPSAVFTVEP